MKGKLELLVPGDTRPVAWFVVRDPSPWTGIEARATWDEEADQVSSSFEWDGEPAATSESFSPERPKTSAAKGLSEFASAPRPRSFRAQVATVRCLADGVPIASRALRVIPRLQAHLSWLMLVFFLVLALVRLLIVAWALEKSAADALILALGGVGVASWIISKAKVVAGWFQRAEAPLFRRAPAALVLGCWTWLGCTSTGHGRNEALRRAHESDGRRYSLGARRDGAS